MWLPNAISSVTVNQYGLSSTSAANNMALDSTPAMVFGSKFARTITIFPTISWGWKYCAPPIITSLWSSPPKSIRPLIIRDLPSMDSVAII